MKRPSTPSTRLLLSCGMLAGPVYAVVVVGEAIGRRFDLAHNDASLLSLGHLGWIQIANFVLTGLLSIACAAGVRRVLRGERRLLRGEAGGTWGPRLLAIYGAGLVAAGIFVADPANGFPAGTPAGRAKVISWHGTLHFVTAAVAFSALIAACFVIARRYKALGHPGWAWYSRLSGLAFLAAFFAVATGSQATPVTVGFGIGVLIAWTWMALTAWHLTARHLMGMVKLAGTGSREPDVAQLEQQVADVGRLDAIPAHR